MQSEKEALYYRKFNTILEPVKVMMMKKKHDLDTGEWIAFIERTKLSVLTNPVEYLGDDMPERQVTVQIVESIFNRFLVLELSR